MPAKKTRLEEVNQKVVDEISARSKNQIKRRKGESVRDLLRRLAENTKRMLKEAGFNEFGEPIEERTGVKQQRAADLRRRLRRKK